MPARKLCIQCDPMRYVEIVMQLKTLGDVTADEAADVLWFDGTLTVELAEALPGVIRAIEYVRPRWTDVLGDVDRRAIVNHAPGSPIATLFVPPPVTDESA